MEEQKEPFRDDEIQKKLRNLESKMNHDADQRLAEIRDEYLSYSDDEKRRFKKWVASLVGNIEPEDINAYVAAKIQFLIQEGQDSVKQVTVSPASLERAIPFWDRGHEYLPKFADH